MIAPVSSNQPRAILNFPQKHLFLAAISLIAMFVFQFPARSQEILIRDELRDIIQQSGVAGAFAGYDVSKDRLYLVNEPRARTRVNPASTFKIANSLIALETGVVRDENEIIPYRSDTPPLIREWARDMSMRDAIRLSNVPIYQELARRIGLTRYREWLTRLSYGNAMSGAVVDRFWLDGPLVISAVEEAHFVAALAQQKLPASRRSQEIVRDILKYEVLGDRTLYAKTGWCRSCKPQIGWWVGWVEHRKDIFAFALNIDIRGPQDLDKRMSIVKDLLLKLGVI